MVEDAVVGEYRQVDPLQFRAERVPFGGRSVQLPFAGGHPLDHVVESAGVGVAEHPEEDAPSAGRQHREHRVERQFHDGPATPQRVDIHRGPHGAAAPVVLSRTLCVNEDHHESPA